MYGLHAKELKTTITIEARVLFINIGEPRRQTRGSAHLVGWTRAGHWWGYNMWLGLGRDTGLCNLEAEVKPPSQCTQISGLRFSLSTQRCFGRPPLLNGSSRAAVTGSLGLEMFFFGRNCGRQGVNTSPVDDWLFTNAS